MAKKNSIKSVMIISIVIWIIIALIVSIIYVQEKMFFYPWHDTKSYSELLKKDKFKEIKIDNNGNLLHGWFVNNTNKNSAPLLIFFQGNAQNSSNTCYYFEKDNKFDYFENYNIMIIDYPGYGLSDGYPSDKTMFEAALKVYDYAIELENVEENEIVIMGYSIGTGVATYLASQRNVKGLILVAPYDQALSLYNNTLNIFYGPFKLLAKYKFNSIEYAPKINVNPLIIASKDDEVIDYNFSLNLSNYFKEIYKFILLDNKVKHTDFFANEETLNNIKEYLNINY